MAEPEISVVVPTRYRPGRLRRCLRALAADGAAQVEIVVVDDGSSDADEVARAAAAFGARVARLEGAGASAARNAGFEATGGRYVCFTDDDCEPQPGWAAALAGRLRAGADVVAGPTVAGRAGEPLATAAQLVSNAFVGGRPLWFAPTSNLGVRREFFAGVRFDAAFDAAEDRDWYRRAQRAGAELGFEPAAVVKHFPDLSLADFWRKQVHYGRGAYRFRRRHREPLEPPSFYGRLVRDGFRDGVEVGALVCLAQVAAAAGFVAAATDARV